MKKPVQSKVSTTPAMTMNDQAMVLMHHPFAPLPENIQPTTDILGQVADRVSKVFTNCICYDVHKDTKPKRRRRKKVK